MKHQGKIFSIIYILCIVSILLISTGCSSTNVKSHMGTAAGGAVGYTTCRGLLDTNVALTAACTLVGAWWGSNIFYTDMDIHNAVFIDTLNTAPGKRSHTNWGSANTGNWGSITINRSYVKNSRKCTEYTSVISIQDSWPMNSIQRGSEFGVACQHPDGRWEIVDSTTKGWGWW